MFHKEGFKIITITIIAVLIGILLTHFLVPYFYLRVILFVIFTFFLVIILQFFRNPKRKTVFNDKHILSPVDGKVVVIEEVFEKEYYKENRIQVSVFMSPINVHVTRNPIGGNVLFSKYHPGKFLVAWHPKSSEENERTTVVIGDSSFSILYRQIAGALAKRIVNYAKKGDSITQGGDNGFIKFGSRVDVFLPLGTKVDVNLGDKVRGGESILASL